MKRGEKKGYVKISLRGFTTDEKITIQRKIDVHNKSDWTLNGNFVMFIFWSLEYFYVMTVNLLTPVTFPKLLEPDLKGYKDILRLEKNKNGSFGIMTLFDVKDAIF